MTLLVIKIPNSSRRSAPSSSLSVAVAIALFTLLALTLPPKTLAATTTLSNVTRRSVGYLDATLPVHQLRSAYELVQARSWQLIEKQFAITAKLTDATRGKIVRELFAYHDEFISDRLVPFELANKDQLPKRFPEVEHFYEWNHVQSHIDATSSLFEVFREYLKTHVGEVASPDFDTLGAKDFAETVLYDKKWPIEKSFNDIHSVMVGQGLYYKMATDSTDHVCRSQRSAQQMLYQLYTAVALTELKGYAMMQFSWMLLRTYGVGNFTKEADLMRQRFEARTGKTHVVLQKVMERADNSLFRCDPASSKHVEGETYERVTKLLQGYVENEVDMNQEETCRETCGHYQITESFTCFKELYCAKQPKCTGKVLYCQYLDSDMWICPSKPNSGRRYDYIEYEDGRILGKKKTCTRGTTKVDSWWRYLFWHCSYCFCVCDEQGYGSDRYFSLRPSVSDTADNKIVTGVRFRKVNRVLHLQIQQGVLSAQGFVDPATIAWKDVSAFKITDRNVTSQVDYHTLTWSRRAIDLNEVQGTPGHVLTGVRFVVVGDHLNLEARFTEFDFDSGRLVEPQTTSVWSSSYHTQIGQNTLSEIKMQNPDIPTESKGRSLINRKPNQFIEFTHTGLDADAAQTTIPYLDAQDVVPKPPMPLAGVGLYHKAAPGSGGFVGPRVFTYDVTAHIQVPNGEAGKEL